MQSHYPKHVRIIVLVDSIGRTTARTASQYRLTAHDDRIKGFSPIAQFTIPMRRLLPAGGWNFYYRHFITEYVR